jgi:hypothetical protein
MREKITLVVMVGMEHPTNLGNIMVAVVVVVVVGDMMDIVIVNMEERVETIMWEVVGEATIHPMKTKTVLCM